jgi:hypothetical protein
MALAYLVLAVHLAIIAFNLFGLVAIPLGWRRGWAFVHAPLWRTLHVAACGAVALQAVAGRACFLTIWQDDLAGTATAGEPLIMRWVNSLVYWPLPMWVFTVVYAAVFAYVLALLWLVPLRRRRTRPRRTRDVAEVGRRRPWWRRRLRGGDAVLRPRRADGPRDGRRENPPAAGSRR